MADNLLISIKLIRNTVNCNNYNCLIRYGQLPNENVCF